MPERGDHQASVAPPTPAAAGDTGRGGLVATLRYATILVWQAGRRRLVLAALLQGLAAVLLAAQVLIAKEALEAVLDADRGAASLSEAVLPLVALAAATGLASLAGPVLLQQQRLLGELVQRATYDRVLDVTGSLDLISYESPEIFDRLQRIQANALPRPLLVTQGLVQLLGSAAGVLGLVAALLALEPLLVPVLLAAGLPLLLLGQKGSRAEFAFALEQTPVLRRRQYLRGVLTGRNEAKEVRAFDVDRLLRQRYDALWDRYLVDLRALVRQRLRQALLSSLLLTTSMAATFVVLVFLVVRGRIQLAEAGAAAIGVRLLAGRLEQLFNGLGKLFESALFLRELREFLAWRLPSRPPEAEGALPPLQELSARKITFRYPTAAVDVLHGVDLELRRGEVVALVGENGSGKTTLVKVLAGLYPPTSGSLLWNGRSLDGPAQAALRRRTTVLFQDFVRYALSARDNIAMGARQSTDEVMTSARSAGAEGLIERLPDGVDTLLSTEYAGGAELSGGQWQRVAFARAVHRDADLVLLDEPSAALDPRAERALHEAVRAVFADRAVILVSHQASTVRSADRIVVIADGCIVEQGTHEQLLKMRGAYAQLYAASEAEAASGATGVHGRASA